MEDTNITPERKLATAIIIQALKDYHKKPAKKASPSRLKELALARESAMVFLSGDELLYFWCNVAGIEPRLIINNFKTINYKDLPNA